MKQVFNDLLPAFGLLEIHRCNLLADPISQ